jgi:hypothetical protein
MTILVNMYTQILNTIIWQYTQISKGMLAILQSNNNLINFICWRAWLHLRSQLQANSGKEMEQMMWTDRRENTKWT